MAFGLGAYGIEPFGAPLGVLVVGGVPLILNSQGAVEFMKSQFISSENLQIVFPPFLDTSAQDFITSGDVATLVVVKPGGSILSPAPTLVRNAADFWTAEVVAASFFEEGEWTIKATSDDANALDQYKSVVWGDYMTDIRQATFGRWKIDGTQLKLYANDNLTVIRTFDLKDAGGSPTASQIFERDPV